MLRKLSIIINSEKLITSSAGTAYECIIIRVKTLLVIANECPKKNPSPSRDKTVTAIVSTNGLTVVF